MICEGCGNQEAYRTRTMVSYIDGKYERDIFCDSCGNAGSSFLPDVAWDGKPEINLADDDRTGKPRVFASRMEKYLYLKERGLREASDSVHGSKFHGPPTKAPDKAAIRAEAMQAVRHVKSMGRDMRRQQYLKILKEAEKHR